MLPDETGLEAWLRYAALPAEITNQYPRYSHIIALTDDESSPVYTAGKELQLGLSKILGQDVILQTDFPAAEAQSSIIVGTIEKWATVGGNVHDIPSLKEDGMYISCKHGVATNILGQNERGALYGAFEFLMLLSRNEPLPELHASSPSAPIRWVNEWDNLDGSIERGYAGPSIYFKDGYVVDDLTRAGQYARLLASVRLNGIIVNNVNSDAKLFNPTNMKGLTRIADIMRPWGVRIGVALYFDTPKGLGGLPTSDPLDPSVIAWWDDMTTRLYQHVPDMLGYLIKANSEGQPGPLTYGRTLADGANLFARALQKHGDGIVMYRAFVYNHHLDESNWKNDRANAAVEYFEGLDTEFEDNVIVQIKYGPIDFQIREPPSPLLGHLRKTPIILELQVAQEYLGQQDHVVYLPPLWRTILDFDFQIDNKPSLVRDIVSGERFNWSRAGYAAVVNVGNDPTWLGSHLAMSNLYAYGRYTWNPQSDEVDVIRDWSRLTFGLNKTIESIITSISMKSWRTYEDYSGNLGIQTLCDIVKTCHFGPSPAAHDGNGWGQWTRADAHALGMDRTVATGTGNAGQYPPAIAAQFEKIETTPDELLLWFHHVPYTHVLKSGKTVIQHFYDAHYDGARVAQTFPEQWETLRGLIDDARFNHVLFRLRFQAGHALVWRDSVNTFYNVKCGIADEQGRVGNHPWRIEAEAMELEGYEAVSVTPFEAASGNQAIVAVPGVQSATAQTVVTFPSGLYDVAINYYDHLGGTSQYQIFLNDRLIGAWAGDLEKHLGHDFSDLVDGHSATRITFKGVTVNNGDRLRIVGRPDGAERAPVDYVSFLPEGIID
ncbi:glycoside hydrolase family 67 protein [Penicillium macrosclerotiorum]|uniref:glycoside hydrolase family 67 protein n=1 Tax=Penicillium macrosclerotiorum TaxID=303699 RepID=UPI002546C0B1|nr:glycoside hydrolase family 67 protein [Penicillium macrosclerotiorum]KAJ5690737.1 glycoside hydrolase family 67 protein [Penicillium macrosclerotiorum]